VASLGFSLAASTHRSSSASIASNSGTLTSSVGCSAAPLIDAQRGRGLSHAKSNYKAKRSEQSLTPAGGRWIVVIAGKYRVSGPGRTGNRLGFFGQRRWQPSLPR